MTFVLSLLWLMAPVEGLPGWSLDEQGEPRAFSAARDAAVTYKGAATARLDSLDTGAKYGSLSQVIDAADYRGKRVLFSVVAKTDAVADWTGLWLRLDGERGRRIYFENTQVRPLKGTHDWTPLRIVADVPMAANMIAFGLGQSGQGRSWFANVKFELVDASVPLTRLVHDKIGNGDFEEAEVGPWFLSGGGRELYGVRLDPETKHRGKQSARLEATKKDTASYATLMQFFDASPYIGKRLQARAWLKSEGVERRGDFWARCQAADSPGDGPGLAGGHIALPVSADWRSYALVFDVPQGSEQVQFGVGLSGPGVVWVDDVEVKVVDVSTPLFSGTPKKPANLDFSQDASAQK